MSWETLFTPENCVALLTLTALEIVLGIDNVVFIAIVAGKLPEDQRRRARNTGLLLAMGMRVVLLLGITWIMGLKATLFTVSDIDISGKGLILIAGGLFLIAKATYEIHHKLVDDGPGTIAAKAMPFARVIVQILLLDLVFSLDSVITAVGMANALWVMITAVVVAVLVMLAFAGVISRFVERHPTLKILALSFLLLIGVTLVVEGCGGEVNKGYIYAAMGFSLFVEALNLFAGRKKRAAAEGRVAA